MPKSLSLYLSYDSPRNPYKEPWRVVEEVKLGILNPQGEMLTDKEIYCVTILRNLESLRL